MYHRPYDHEEKKRYICDRKHNEKVFQALDRLCNIAFVSSNTLRTHDFIMFMQFEILILITSICYLERSRLNQGR